MNDMLWRYMPQYRKYQNLWLYLQHEVDHVNNFNFESWVYFAAELRAVAAEDACPE